jgi:hypothetical protein
MNLTQEQLEALQKAFGTQASREKFNEFFKYDIDDIRVLKEELALLAVSAQNVLMDSSGRLGSEILGDEEMADLFKEYKTLSVDLRRAERKINDAERLLEHLGITLT